MCVTVVVRLREGSSKLNLKRIVCVGELYSIHFSRIHTYTYAYSPALLETDTLGVYECLFYLEVNDATLNNNLYIKRAYIIRIINYACIILYMYADRINFPEMYGMLRVQC